MGGEVKSHTLYTNVDTHQDTHTHTHTHSHTVLTRHRHMYHWGAYCSLLLLPYNEWHLFLYKKKLFASHINFCFNHYYSIVIYLRMWKTTSHTSWLLKWNLNYESVYCFLYFICYSAHIYISAIKEWSSLTHSILIAKQFYSRGIHLWNNHYISSFDAQ